MNSVYRKTKIGFKFQFRFHALPRIPRTLDRNVHKKFTFQHHREIKISQNIQHFGQTEKTKIL